MNACESLRSSLGGLVSLCLPGDCVLCGEPLEPGAAFSVPGEGRGALGPPLCRSCAAELAPIEGRRCPRCGAELVSEAGLCLGCRSRPRAFDEALALFRFEGGFRRLLGAYKFGDRRSLAPFFASLLGPRIAARWPGWPVAPVPPRAGKLRERGWDQVEDLALCLGSLGFELIRPLERLGSRQQKRLKRAERGANALGAYRLRPGAAAPESVVLLDDVVTTGATAEACAAALKSGGAKRVAFVALAAD